MDYDPTIPGMRTALAASLLMRLDECGFAEVEKPDRNAKYCGMERVFARPVNDRTDVRVYTTIVDGKVRNVGKDSIRVAAVYTTKDGKTRGLVKNRRVHRMGNVDAITERMVGRMRAVWKNAARPERCRCGAPKFVTKKGNLCCAEICWK